MIRLETDRLLLMSLDDGDAAFILELLNDPDFIANIADKHVRTEQDAITFIQSGSWVQHSPPGYGQFKVVEKKSQASIGVCGILYREAFDLSDVGFAFLPEYRRKGYALESAKRVVRYAHETLSLDRIVGLTSPENHASIQILKKLGMSLEKTIKMSDMDPGTLVFGMNCEPERSPRFPEK